MNTFRQFAFATLAAAAFWASPAMAGNVVADPDQIATIMRNHGYKAEIKKTSDDTYIASGSGGYNFSVYFYGCDAGKECKSIQFYAGYTPKTKPTASQLVEYARTNRWGRLYIDKDGDPVMEMDVDLEQGGMSEALFMDNLAYFEAVMTKFATFVFSADDKK